MSSGSESDAGAPRTTGRDRWADDEDVAEEARRARKRQRKEKKAKKAKKKAKKAHKRGDRAPSPAALGPAGPPVADSGPEEQFGAAMPPQSSVDEYGYPLAEEVLASTEQVAPAPALEPEPVPEEAPGASATDLVRRSMLHGCRSVEAYEKLSTIDEGTYGVVHKARCRASGEIVALKQLKLPPSLLSEGFPLLALREVNILLSLRHPNVLTVREMVVGSSSEHVFMVMEYCDSDLQAAIRALDRSLSQAEIKSLMQQLLSATEHLHGHWVMHRDLKTANLLYTKEGRLCVCDFGMARKFEDPIRPYSPTVVTPTYRAPELYLGAKKYTTALDMWSIGCIFGELVLGRRLFPAKSEAEMLSKIFELVGSPSDETFPGFRDLPGAKTIHIRSQPNRLAEVIPTTPLRSQSFLTQRGLDLLSRMLALDPARRMSAAEALKHPWFSEEPSPKPVLPAQS